MDLCKVDHYKSLVFMSQELCLQHFHKFCTPFFQQSQEDQKLRFKVKENFVKLVNSFSHS